MVAAGHEDLVQSWSEDYALRMPQSSERAHPGAARKVDYLERVVAESREKKASRLRGVESEVIEPPVNTRQRNRRPSKRAVGMVKIREFCASASTASESTVASTPHIPSTALVNR